MSNQEIQFASVDMMLSDQARLATGGPLGSLDGMKVLKGMNSMVDEQDEFVKSLAPRVDVH
jgi:hypothetical protein